MSDSDLKQTSVRLFFGASAYACITECGIRFDVRLAPGRKASKALREYADIQRARAECLIDNAERAERAAAILDTKESES